MRSVLGHNATLGYYAQEHEQIQEGMTVLDHVRSVSDQVDLVLRTLLGHFLLADKIDQDAATLSGGEKTKLALAMVVLGASQRACCSTSPPTTSTPRQRRFA